MFNSQYSMEKNTWNLDINNSTLDIIPSPASGRGAGGEGAKCTISNIKFSMFNYTIVKCVEYFCYTLKSYIENSKLDIICPVCVTSHGSNPGINL